MLDPQFSPKKVESLLGRLTPKWNKWIPITPTDKQYLGFCLGHVRELFWGGAAGGGKSVFLLGAAAQYVDCPGYAALVLRKNYPDLSQPGGLIFKSHEWWDGRDDCWYSEERKNWTFACPGGGRSVIQFGHMDSSGEKNRYKGGEYSGVFIDEATDFLREDAMFLNSRIRGPVNAPWPYRLRLASNPGSVGHDWIKERYLGKHSDPNRVFVPAFLSDNRHVNQAQYEEFLNQLDPVTRARLLNGDWTVTDGGSIFNLSWWADHYIEVPPINIAGRIRAWDLAAGVTKDHKETAGVLMSRTNKGHYVIENVVHGRWAPGERDAVIRATAQMDGEDTQIKIEEEGGSGGVAQNDSLMRYLAGFRVESVKVTGSKFYRAGPLASQVQAGNVSLVTDPIWNRVFVDQLHAADPENEDLLMDMMDAASLAFNCLSKCTLNPFAIETPDLLKDRSQLTEQEKDLLFQQENEVAHPRRTDLYDEVISRDDIDWSRLFN